MLRKASASEVMTWELQKTEQHMFENVLGDEELEIERPDAVSDDEAADDIVQENNEQDDEEIHEDHVQEQAVEEDLQDHFARLADWLAQKNRICEEQEVEVESQGSTHVRNFIEAE